MADPSWAQRLEAVYETMREMSVQTEPQEMVQAYARRVSRLFPVDRRISLSRRGLQFPEFRVTRYSGWKETINPWLQPERLPLLSGGLFAKLLYSDRPEIIDRLELSADDPAYPYLEGQQSLMAIPMLDGGKALNMVISTRREPAAFRHEQLPDTFWLANLFGRATHNLVLRQDVQEAYEAVDREMRTVADIQRSLLPQQLPTIPGLDVATDYQTSRRAGGDYYDFFPLPNDRWGMLIADVSGHGTPAAVVMAITHCIAHLFPGDPTCPGARLGFINQQLAERYTHHGDSFVTALLADYEPSTRTLTCAAAGHPPPRWYRAGRVSGLPLDEIVNLPLGVAPHRQFADKQVTLSRGDWLVWYTDGVTESVNASGEMFGVRRLDRAIADGCCDTSSGLIERINRALHDFTGDTPAPDDRTLIVLRVTEGAC